MNQPRRLACVDAFAWLLGAMLLFIWHLPAVGESSDAPDAPDTSSWDSSPHDRPHHRVRVQDGRMTHRVAIGHDATLEAGERAEAVVAVLGSATSRGEVSDSVVSVVGNARVTGAVGDAVVSVLGNTYVDAKVDGDVVAVLGGVELGPHADVGGDVVTVGGAVVRDPAAQLQGDIHELTLGMHSSDFRWLSHWISECVMNGRLLAFAPGLGWAWTLALIALALYTLAAVLFRSAVERCVHVLNSNPGATLLAALLTLMSVPMLVVLLCVTVVGILGIPMVGIGVIIIAFFGKLVALAWVGSRLLRTDASGARAHPALAVAVGGVIMLLLYVVPVLGLFVYKLAEFIGIGAVVYALLLEWRERRTAASVQDAKLIAAPDATAAPPAAAPPPADGSPARVSQGTAAGYPRAGFWVRMGALLIDLILTGAVLHWVLHQHDLHLLSLAAYGAVMWKIRGATIGGIICNLLYVARLDGRPMGWSTAIVRALGCFLSLFIGGLGFVWIALDGERQAWHDKIAGTVVVMVPKGAPLV